MTSKNSSETTRRAFIAGAAGAFAAMAAGEGAPAAKVAPAAKPAAAKPAPSPLDAELDRRQGEVNLVTPEINREYRKTGKTKGFAALERLERGFAKALAEIKSTQVTGVPAIWQIYNMGFVVKTKETLFSIDLNHRRDLELAPMLDFALITHNHGDHFREPFYGAMNGKGKTVISNFKDNYGAADWKKGGRFWDAGGYTRAEKTFKIKDVEIRTALTDHNPYLIDFTTTFEIRVGGWRLFHTGDCGNAKKLKTVWGEPDLWLVFPGCGIKIDDAYRRIRPKRMAFGHLWELGHSKGRLTAAMVKRAKAKVAALGGRVDVPFWGERVL